MRCAALFVILLAVMGERGRDVHVMRGDAAGDWMPLPDDGSDGHGHDGHDGASRSRTARVRRAGARHVGLETGLPDDGAYARGIALDAAGEQGDALRAYDEALADLDGLASTTDDARARLAGWREKIAWQRDQSENLLEEEAYVAVMPTSLQAHFRLGLAAHAKFVTTRAFLGRGPRALWEQACAAFRDALAIDPHYAPARLGLATLYAEAGLRHEAAMEFAKLGRHRDDPDNALWVGAYLAAIDDRDGAFTALARAAAVDRDARRWIAVSNDFDALRDDPRFPSLVADRDEPTARAGTCAARGSLL